MSARVTLALPADAALLGAVLHAQAFVVDPHSALGLASTAGRRFVIGG